MLVGMRLSRCGEISDGVVRHSYSHVFLTICLCYSYT